MKFHCLGRRSGILSLAYILHAWPCVTGFAPSIRLISALFAGRWIKH